MRGQKDERRQEGGRKEEKEGKKEKRQTILGAFIHLKLFFFAWLGGNRERDL